MWGSDGMFKANNRSRKSRETDPVLYRLYHYQNPEGNSTTPSSLEAAKQNHKHYQLQNIHLRIYFSYVM